MSPSTLELFQSGAFRLGLFVGLLGLALVFVLSLLVRARSALPVGGVVAATCAVVLLEPSREVGFGLLLLVGAGLVHPWTRKIPVLPAVAAVPGAFVIGRALAGLEPDWLPAYAVLAVSTIAAGTASFTARYAGQAFGPALFAVTALGVLFAVPDTERALGLFAIALPLAFMSWPAALASVGPVGAYPLAGVLVWVIAVDGQTRPAVVVGTLAVAGVFVAEPLVAAATSRLPFGGLVAGWRALALVGAFHGVVVVAAARVAAQRRGVVEAAAVAAVLIALLCVAIYVSQPKSRPSSA